MLSRWYIGLLKQLHSNPCMNVGGVRLLADRLATIMLPYPDAASASFGARGLRPRIGSVTDGDDSAYGVQGIRGTAERFDAGYGLSGLLDDLPFFTGKNQHGITDTLTTLDKQRCQSRTRWAKAP